MKGEKLMSGLIASMIVVSLVGCNSQRTGTNTSNSTGTQSQSAKSAEGEIATTEEKTKITVTYREDGALEKSALYQWLTAAYESYEKKDEIELNIAPISAPEGDYFAKIALALQSPDTAPDLVTEDTFQLATDVSAGYLTNLDEMVKDYSDWNEGKYYEKLKQGVIAADGSVYGIPYNTDTRGLWYNKEIFKQAGLPEEWIPKNWKEIIEAAKTIKEKVPDVVPFWCNSGVATGEATSMQTYEMLLYGTGERLLDESTGKWIISSQAILDSLNFLNDIYSNGYGPSLSKVLNGQSSNTSAREYLPRGKLAISLDGSWIVGNYGENGVSPWTEYKDVLGFAAMPTQHGDGDGTITLAGGWAWAIPKQSKNKEATFEFIKHLMDPAVYTPAIITMGSIATRQDVLEDPAYADLPFMKTATEFLQSAYFRPKDDQYPAVSTHIQTMVEAVVSGTRPEDAMKDYAANVTRTVEEVNVVSK